jgi:hypothetical protein
MKNQNAFVVGVASSMVAGLILYLILKDKEVAR